MPRAAHALVMFGQGLPRPHYPTHALAAKQLRETRRGATVALWAAWLSVGWVDFWQGCQLYDPCRALRIHRQKSPRAYPTFGVAE
jgi:hypothetical protein